MARIRSVKPDFFTSPKIASLPLSSRLTFIGLWTHVDDNGVCLDNDRLINAALWPLEEDPLETLMRTREDLTRLHEARIVARYEADGKRFLFITHWDEHQKVQHPGKPRYPRPATGEGMPVTCNDAAADAPSGDPHETLTSPPEILTPEQGAGSREQGRKTSRPAAAGSDGDPDFAAFWSAYPRKDDKEAARKAYRSAASTRHVDPKTIIAAAEQYAADCKASRIERKFIKTPARWLNAGSYDNDNGTALAPTGTGGYNAHWDD